MESPANVSRRHFATLTGAAAAGLIAAPALLTGKSAAAQQSPVPGGGDAFQMLIDDHKKVAALMQQIASTDDPSKRMSLLRQLADALTRHAVAEENVVYPAVRQMSLTGIDAMSAVKDHADIKTYLYVLENTTDNAEWKEQFGELQEEVKSHVASEEKDMFPALRDKLSTEQLAKLTQAVNRAMNMCKA